ncbi:MAG: cell envelope-related transcriptional attenuator [uncultured bacterium]|nr:MAG: cell envelope-related transcriptional attenuator [uncultured bacterium]OGH13989.1 MAG: hypothetical protein A2687_05990 [Candidatus Levybacteria bacterium RIFCSPHIGHO2_01_FULL_38_26]
MRKKIFFVLGILFFVGIVFFVLQGPKFFPIILEFLFNREIELKKTENNINVILLGTGGGVHQGPDLTDTIIFASIDPGKNRVVLVSIPRDLWVPDLRAKINSAYAYGNSKKEQGGLILAKAVVADIINQPIDYAIRIDFNGFVKAVDLIGGLDVDVERTFDDFEYPIVGSEDDLCGRKEEEIELLATASSQLEAFPCRYTHVRFNQGIQHMNGETALQFVRSRHAEGEEGTDFARSKRQEKIIASFKDKVFALETLVNPVKVIGLYSTIKDSIDTNIQEEEIDDFIKLAQKMQEAVIYSATIDYGDEKQDRPGLLLNPPISSDFRGQWVLIPRIGNGDFSEIQKYVECEIKVGECPIAENPL